MWRLGGLLALLAAATRAQDVPRPTRLRIYEVRTALRFNEGELQRVNFRYDRSSGIKSDIARSLVDCGLTTDRGFVFEVAFFEASGLDAAIARGQAAAMAPGEVSDLTDDGTSPTSPSFLNHADAIRFLERARSRR
jgi:hypothetical protein